MTTRTPSTKIRKGGAQFEGHDREGAGATRRMPPIRVLNVAEKPSVAKEVSRVLSNGGCSSRRGASQYNMIWEFPYTVMGQRCDMVFTSVTGHVMGLDFPPSHRGWNTCNPRELIDGARVVKQVDKGKEKVAENLRKEASRCAWLILWLDCDREGENIAFEVMDICKQSKPGIRCLRARFSALSHNDVTRALANLRDPNPHESMAVDMRQELDLRFGSAFTRFNTLLLQRSGVAARLPGADADGKGNIVSYGPCQFPTLGFIVQRKWDIDAHVPENFWKIKLSHTVGNGREASIAEFEWSRDRLFDEHLANALFTAVRGAGEAVVTREGGTESKKWPPHPLNTLEMQKRLNRAIRVSPEQIMKLAEELYQAGFISYPRTETDKFPNDFDYRTSIEQLAPHPKFGFHATALGSGRFRQPPGGGHDDKAHPPIYPTKLASNQDYNTWRNRNPKLIDVYEFVCRHFLASCSLPAVSHKTTVEASMGGERFKATGNMIKELNYLEVYGKGPVGGPVLSPTYDGWSQNTIPSYRVGQRFVPSELSLRPGRTQPPPLLSETDLLSKMEAHQIGTDATQAQHIEKVVGERGYARKVNDNRLMPTELGEALCAGYARMGLAGMWLPHLRAGTEADTARVARGEMDAAVGLRNAIGPAIEAYRGLEAGKQRLIDAVTEFCVPGGGGWRRRWRWMEEEVEVGSMAAPAAVEARAAAATRGSDWTIPSAPSACVPGRAAAAPSSC